MKPFERHPLADCIPLMTAEELLELRRSIRENGFDSDFPIYLYEGKVLAGWHRYLACISEKIKPVFEDYEGDEPASFLLRNDIQRRHLSIVQRLAACETMRPKLEAEAKARKIRKPTTPESEEIAHDNLSFARVQQQTGTPATNSELGRVANQIAKAAHVSPRTAHSYHTVQEKGSDELKKALAEEVVSVKDASEAARNLPPNEQDEAVATVRKGQAKTLQKASLLCERCQRVGAIDGCANCEEVRKRRSKGNQAAKRRSGKDTFAPKKVEAAFGVLVRIVSATESAIGRSDELDRVRHYIDRSYEAWQRVLKNRA